MHPDVRLQGHARLLFCLGRLREETTAHGSTRTRARLLEDLHDSRLRLNGFADEPRQTQ